MSHAEEKEQTPGALVPLGYVFAVILPFVGLVLGIIAATRPSLSARRHGPWIIAVAALAFAGWGTLIYTEAQSSAHHAAAQAEEAVSHADEEHATEQADALEREKEAAEDEYCSEHPGAGEHMAGGFHYYGCTTASEP